MENGNHHLPLETIVANEIRKYQLDNGLKLDTDVPYNCPLKWWRLNQHNHPSLEAGRAYLSYPRNVSTYRTSF
jgi:hypothetical protein